MTIQKIKIGHFDGIPALTNIEIIPKGANIFLKGENGVGKSSFMQFIEILRGNIKEIPPQFDANGEVTWINRRGETWILSLETKKGKPVITARSENGMKDTSKGFLYNICGTPSTYTIEEFVSWSETAPGRRKQVDEFRKMLDQETLSLIDQLNAQVEANYKSRTYVNQKIEMLKGFMRETRFKDIDITIEPIDVSGIETQIQTATKKNTNINKVKADIDQFSQTKISLEEEKAKLFKRISEIDADSIDISDKINKGKEWLKTNIEIDIDTLVSQVSSASEHNIKCAAAKELKDKEVQLSLLKEESENLTILIDSSKSEIERTIKELSSPIEGLFFSDDGLIYNGVPVSNTTLSTSESMELGYKMKVAQNPEFDVLFIENSNLLGQKRFDDIKALAAKYGLQIIYEEVVRGQNGLTIEIEGK